jgi:RsiW-degrading membrane proteinase PrsW (M82 family)
MIIYILAAVLPAVFLMRYIYNQDKYEKEPASLLWKLVLGGVFAALAAMVLEYLIIDWFLPLFSITDETSYSIAEAILVGLIEEGCKFYFLYRYTWNNPNFNFRYDGVVYAVFCSLGFAAFENVQYVFNYGLSVAVSRALLAIPAHMGFAVFMGPGERIPARPAT